MLTREILAANTVLTGLTAEQIAAICTLSENDENAVIAQKTGKIYGDLDADILSVTGVAKNGTEKTYDYAKRVLGDFKIKAQSSAELQSTITSLTKEKERLERAVADGAGDAETKRALKQAQTDLTAITSQFNELNTKYQQAQTDNANALFGFRVDSALQTASAGLKFKAGLPETVTGVLLNQAMAKIKGMNPEFIDDGKGGTLIAFKDANGAIMRNPNNQLNPFSPSELLQQELRTMQVLDETKPKPGGGTIPPVGGGGGSVTVDISGVKTRVEAYDTITAGLLAQGITRDSEAFDTAMSQAWKDNNVASLPEK